MEDLLPRKIGRLQALITTSLFFVIVSFEFSDAADPTPCSTSLLPPLVNGARIIAPDGKTALYYCLEDYHFDNLFVRAIVYCNDSGMWVGKPPQCVKTKCLPNPCLNGGKCSIAEDPFNTGYTCMCPLQYGGRRCQVFNPCSTCPNGTMCMITFASDFGRYCYDTNMRLVT